MRLPDDDSGEDDSGEEDGDWERHYHPVTNWDKPEPSWKDEPSPDYRVYSDE